LLADVFDHRLAVFQSSFELLPDQGLDQGIPGLQDQVAAIGAMDSPGLDHGEIGGDGHQLVLVFDLAKQVVIVGIGLDDDRRARCIVMADE